MSLVKERGRTAGPNFICKLTRQIRLDDHSEGMTIPFDPSTLDLSGYRTMSVFTLSGSISVGKSLRDLQPFNLPDYVEKAADKLAIAVDEAEQALTVRLDQKADLGLERSFDTLVDRIWVMLRGRMEFWDCYTHEGVALLSEKEQIEADLEGGRKLATIAEELLARLFGDGVEFLRLPYPQQASHMAARLRYLETHGLEAEFAELVGTRPVALAKICQRRYEAMVSNRSARDTAVTVDLRPFRARIRSTAENYANLLLATLDGGDEEWAKIVLTALRPMLTPRRTRTHDEAEGEGEVVDALETEPAPLEAGFSSSP
jgi:hypothetical protein